MLSPRDLLGPPEPLNQRVGLEGAAEAADQRRRYSGVVGILSIEGDRVRHHLDEERLRDPTGPRRGRRSRSAVGGPRRPHSARCGGAPRARPGPSRSGPPRTRFALGSAPRGSGRRPARALGGGTPWGWCSSGDEKHATRITRAWSARSGGSGSAWRSIGCGGPARGTQGARSERCGYNRGAGRPWKQQRSHPPPGGTEQRHDDLVQITGKT